MLYFVYILQSLKDNKYYIGSSSNVDARLQFHNAGLQRSTRHRTPFTLVYQEALADKTEALVREKQIKSYKGGEAFRKLLTGK
ncbi:MAG: GIY-YIG nuclease family protein [Bacteroidota bacterium]